MKELIVSIGLVLLTTMCIGQKLDSINMLNLVPNAGFEHSIGCPSMDAQITRARGWSSPNNASSDYCNTFGWPHSDPRWEQSPFQGNGYVLLVAGHRFREYAQVRLSSPLIKGQKYSCSIFVSGGTDIGMLFTAQKIRKENSYKFDEYQPQIQSHSDSVFTDKEWHIVQGSFIAKGGEKYLTIGSFSKTFSKVQLSKFHNSWSSFIDNVSTKLVVRRKPLKVIQSELSKVQNIKFENRSFELDSSSLYVVKKVLKILNRNKEISIKMIGHTDNNGSKMANRTLSVQRCSSVKRYLTAHGIAGKRIVIEGKGDSEPIVPNTTDENRFKNRRVEFKVI